jgi:hypothetical protein
LKTESLSSGKRGGVEVFAWVPTSQSRPHDRQLVYARIEHGTAQLVTFYARPSPRWEGSSIIYDYQYFAEWAPLRRW